MATPEPKIPLNGHCSIIHEKTLYVYSPQGFQSLKLEEGAEWETLPMDISLTGAQCVKAVPKGGQNARLFIVGGAVNETAASWNYPGLMHYTFATKKWDWLRPETWNTKDRQNHAAAYLEDSQQLLVYAGSQTPGNNGPSSETFLFSTIEPYTVSSLPSAGAPPSVKPMLMAADDKTVIMVGGGATNTAVWKYSLDGGWRDVGVTLQQPIVNQEAVQCTVVKGKDGEVALEKFDMSVTPNKVDRILLINKDGSPAAPGSTVGRKNKRAEVSDWAAYNSTFAPTSTRSGYSLAQGDDGTTVASGGNQTHPLVLFNAQENSWISNKEFFGGQQVISQSESSSIASSSFPTATASPSAIPSSTGVAAVPAGPPDNKGKMLTVLGATLGTIFGIAAVLILILFCLKYRKNKAKQNQGYVEKDRMSFADRGADFMKEAGGSVAAYNTRHNNDSLTSLAIIQGRGANSHKKNQASDASTAGLVKKSSPLGYSDPVELSKFDLKPEPKDTVVRQNSGRNPPADKGAPRARSSGWSRYFANNEATNLASAPADRSTYASDRTSIASQSQYTTYTNSRWNSTRPSQHIAPLEIPKFDGQRLSRVASGSPTLGTPTGVLPHQVQPMQAELGRANSNGSSRSGISHHDDHYFNKPVESWTPVGNVRRTSSQYTGSMVIEPNSKYDTASSYYPDGTDSFYPKSNFSSFYPGQGVDPPAMPDARDSTFTMFPSGNAPATETMPKSKFSSMYPAPPQLGLPQDRESTVTLFPGPNGSQSASHPNQALPSPKFYGAPPRIGHESTVTMFPGPGNSQDKSKDGQSDMSWLNLGTSR